MIMVGEANGGERFEFGANLGGFLTRLNDEGIESQHAGVDWVATDTCSCGRLDAD
jgi:hypothetical protein